MGSKLSEVKQINLIHCSYLLHLILTHLSFGVLVGISEIVEYSVGQNLRDNWFNSIKYPFNAYIFAFCCHCCLIWNNTERKQTYDQSHSSLDHHV